MAMFWLLVCWTGICRKRPRPVCQPGTRATRDLGEYGASGRSSRRVRGQESKPGRAHMDIGRIGIWTAAFEQQPWSAAAEAVAELDELGYGAIWYPEGRGRDTFAQAAMILT